MGKKNEKFFTERDKTFFKVFFLIFIFFVIAINWNDFFGVLNIRTAPYFIKEKIPSFSFFEKEEQEMEERKENEAEEIIFCEGKDRITISAIDITAPIVETQGTSEEEYRSALDTGVVRFPYSVDPGEKGLSVLLGHSAPPNYPDINYDTIFSEIDKLQEGDGIEICYENIFYNYKVIDEERGRKVYEVGESVPPLYPNQEKKEIVLMTCWPPGDSKSRMGVRAIIEK